MIFIILYLFVIGLFIGSFLNVAIDRPFLKKSIIFGRSECDFCHHPLQILDLVPVFSFLFLKGHCRYCHKPLSWQYPLVELTTGIIIAGLFILLHPAGTLSSLAQYTLVCLLVLDLLVLGITDSKYGILPNNQIVVGLILQIILLFFFNQSSLIPNVLTAAVSAAFLGLIVVITKGKGMGMGDVKYALLMGLMVGFPAIIPAYYAAFLTGAVWAIILIVVGKKKFHGGTLAFGPFLIVGTIAAYFWGQQLWTLLLKILRV